MPVSLCGQTGFSGKSSLANSSVGASWDYSSAFYNPAGMGPAKRSFVIADYSRLYLGAKTDIYQQSVAGFSHLFPHSIGASFSVLGNEMQQEKIFSLSASTRLLSPKTIEADEARWGTFAGVRIKYLMEDYIKEKFHLENPDDPLFLKYGYSKGTFSLDLGVIFRKRNLCIGAFLKDANQPSIALSDEVKNPVPLEANLGASFDIHDLARIYTNIDYSNDPNLPADERINPAVGVETYFLNRKLAARGGINRLFGGLGATYFTARDRGGIFVEYSLIIPFSIGTTHRISIGYRFRKPLPRYPNIKIIDIRAKSEKPITRQPMPLEITLENNGKKDVGAFEIELLLPDTTIKEKLPGLKDGEKKTHRFEFVPENSGDIELTATADPDNEKLEIYKDDNSKTARFHIYPRPTVSITAEKPVLKLTQVASIIEDEPIVPLLFFKSGKELLLPPPEDAQIDHSERSIKIIGERLTRNPDVKLLITGFYDTIGDSIRDKTEGEKLAYKRAELIRKKFIEQFPKIEEQIIVADTSSYKPWERRVEKQDFEGTRKGKRLVAEENQRVELKLLPPEITLIPPLTEDKLNELSNILSRNPNIELEITARGNYPTIDLVDSLLFFAEEFRKSLPEELARRAYIRGERAVGEPLNISLKLTADGIFYNPPKRKKLRKDFEVDPEFNRVSLQTKFEGELKPEKFNVTIIDDQGNSITKLAGGKKPGRSFSWDWKLPDGSFADPERTYFAILSATDEAGQTAVDTAEALHVEIKNREELSERFILVQFIFGGTKSEAEYNDARLQRMAKRILARIKRTDSPKKIIVAGHTDNVGVKAGNERLSQRRAEKQLNNLKRYFILYEKLKGTKDLNDFLTVHRTQIIPKGYSDSKPYHINRWQGENLTEILYGDNRTPAGRIANRRVEIEFVGK